MSVFPSICPPIHPRITPFLNLSVRRTIHSSVHPSSHPSVYPSNFLSKNQSLCLPTYLLIYPTIYLFNHIYVYQPTNQSINQSIDQSIYLCLSINQFTNLSVGSATDEKNLIVLIKQIPLTLYFPQISCSLVLRLACNNATTDGKILSCYKFIWPSSYGSYFLENNLVITNFRFDLFIIIIAKMDFNS